MCKLKIKRDALLKMQDMLIEKALKNKYLKYFFTGYLPSWIDLDPNQNYPDEINEAIDLKSVIVNFSDEIREIDAKILEKTLTE